MADIVQAAAADESAARLAFERCPDDVRAAQRLVAALIAQDKPLPDDLHETALRLQLREQPHDMALTYSLVALLCRVGRPPLPDQFAPDGSDGGADHDGPDGLLRRAQAQAEANDPLGVFAALWQLCVRHPQELRGWAEFARRFAQYRDWSACRAAIAKVMESPRSPDESSAACLVAALRALAQHDQLADLAWKDWIDRIPGPLQSSKDAIDAAVEAAARLAFERCPDDVRAAQRLVGVLSAQDKPLPDDLHETALRLQLREQPHDMALTYSLVALLCRLGRPPLPDQFAPDGGADRDDLDGLLRRAQAQAEANDPLGVFAALWQLCVRHPQEPRGWAEFARRFAQYRDWSACRAAIAKVMESPRSPDEPTAGCLVAALRALAQHDQLADLAWKDWIDRLPGPLRSSKDAIDAAVEAAARLAFERCPDDVRAAQRLVGVLSAHDKPLPDDLHETALRLQLREQPHDMALTYSLVALLCRLGRPALPDQFAPDGGAERDGPDDLLRQAQAQAEANDPLGVFAALWQLCVRHPQELRGWAEFARRFAEYRDWSACRAAITRVMESPRSPDESSAVCLVAALRALAQHDQLADLAWKDWIDRLPGPLRSSKDSIDAAVEAAARLAFERCPDDVRAAQRLLAVLSAQDKPLPDDLHETALRLQLREQPHDMALTYSLVALLCRLGRPPLPDQFAPDGRCADRDDWDDLLRLAQVRAEANDRFGVFAALWQLCVRHPQEPRGWAEFARRFADYRDWSACRAAVAKVIDSPRSPDQPTAVCLLPALRALLRHDQLADLAWRDWIDRLPGPLRSSKDAIDLLILSSNFPEVQRRAQARPANQPIDNLVIIGLRKSGNLFFARSMKTTLQCDHVPFSTSTAPSQVVPQALIDFALRKRSVGGEHLTPDEHNLRMLELVGVTHIALLLRDPRDAIISVWHHLERPDIRSNPWGVVSGVAAGYMSPNYYQLSREERLADLVRHNYPRAQEWMLRWLEVANGSPRFRFHINWYEEFALDPRRAVGRMLRFFGHDVDPVLPETSGENSGGVHLQTNFRRGRAGSYRDEAPAALRDLLDRGLDPALQRAMWRPPSET